MKTQTYGEHFSRRSLAIGASNRGDRGNVRSSLYDDTWEEFYSAALKAARRNYLEMRRNGKKSDAPSGKFIFDGSVHTPEDAIPYIERLTDEITIKYIEGPNDRSRMEKRDRNYLRRIQLEDPELFEAEMQDLKTKNKKLYALFAQEFSISADNAPLAPELAALSLKGEVVLGEEAEAYEAVARAEAERDGGTSDYSIATSVFFSTDPRKIALKFMGQMQNHHANDTDIAIGTDSVSITFNQRGDANRDACLRRTLQCLLPIDVNLTDTKVVIPFTALTSEHVRNFKRTYLEKSSSSAPSHTAAPSSSATG